MRGIRLLPLVALGLTGCLKDEVIAPDRTVVSIHAMATTGSSSFGVAISRVAPIGLAQPLTGATVRMTRDSAVLVLVEAGNRSGVCFDPLADDPFSFFPITADAQCYATTLDRPIDSGEQLDVEIELPDGTLVRGSTRTPQPAELLEPAPGSAVPVVFHIERFDDRGFSIRAEPIEVAWQQESTQPADVFLILRRVFRGNVGTESDCGDVMDLETTRSPAFLQASPCDYSEEEGLGDSLWVDVRIVGYDASYTRYRDAVDEQGTGIIVDHLSAGLSKVSGDALVVGVFGSASTSTSPLTLHTTVIDELAAQRLSPTCTPTSTCQPLSVSVRGTSGGTVEERHSRPGKWRSMYPASTNGNIGPMSTP